MSFDRGGKAVANETKYPLIVEVPVAAKGLDIELNRQIVEFHKSRRIPPRFGRSIFRDGQSYYRWCFSDLETARALSNSLAECSTTQLALDLRGVSRWGVADLVATWRWSSNPRGWPKPGGIRRP